jgi:hypothetical protein
MTKGIQYIEYYSLKSIQCYDDRAYDLQLTYQDRLLICRGYLASRSRPLALT